jgi:hypothetical protein
LTAVVVFPTPPFWFAIVMILQACGRGHVWPDRAARAARAARAMGISGPAAAAGAEAAAGAVAAALSGPPGLR